MATGKHFQQRKLRHAWWEIQLKACRQSLYWACSVLAEDGRVNPPLHLCIFVSEIPYFFSALQKFWHLFGETFVDLWMPQEVSAYKWLFQALLGQCLAVLSESPGSSLTLSCAQGLLYIGCFPFTAYPALYSRRISKDMYSWFLLVRFSVIPSSRQFLLTQTRAGSSE